MGQLIAVGRCESARVDDLVHPDFYRDSFLKVCHDGEFKMPKLVAEPILLAIGRAGWTQEDLADQCKLSSKTVWNALNSRPVSRATAQRIATAIGLPVESLVEPIEVPQIRSVAGRWRGCCRDIVMPPHFAYARRSLKYAIHCDLKQDGNAVTGDCTVTGKVTSRVAVRGTAKEAGNVFLLESSNREPVFQDYGSVVLEYDADGQTLRGFFLGRELGHKTPFVLASVELRRVKAW